MGVQLKAVKRMGREKVGKRTWHHRQGLFYSLSPLSDFGQADRVMGVGKIWQDGAHGLEVKAEQAGVPLSPFPII